MHSEQPNPTEPTTDTDSAQTAPSPAEESAPQADEVPEQPAAAGDDAAAAQADEAAEQPVPAGEPEDAADSAQPAEAASQPAPAADDAPAAQPTESAEPPDGAVADTPAEQAAEQEPEGDVGAENPVDLGILEALLFSTHHPLTAARLNELMELTGTKALRKAIKSLNDHYASTQRSFRIEQVAGGYQMLTLPDYGEYLKKLHQREADARLTRSALETLAIIAYKQPILRADVEAIRGVASGETIRSLMEKHLVKIAGRAEEPGRPILYGTTKRFLELFGLNNLKDLPQADPGAKAKKDDKADKAPASSAPAEAPAPDQGGLTAQAAPDQPSPSEPSAPTESADASATAPSSTTSEAADQADSTAAADPATDAQQPEPSAAEDGNKD